MSDTVEMQVDVKAEKEEIEEPEQLRFDFSSSCVKDDPDDPVEKEVDVFISKTLLNKIYILQYPIKPSFKNFDETKILGARIKPKQNKLELDIEMNTTNDNYSKAKGEQFAINVDGKLAPNSKTDSQQKYFRSSLMDKQVYSSTVCTLGQMNRLYHLGILKDDQLHLTPVHSILQMRPNFEYFDIYEKKVKDLKDANQQNETDYSTEEELDNEVDKAELVTMKYSAQTAQAALAQQQEQENWTNLNYVKQSTSKELLVCKEKENTLKISSSFKLI